MIIITMNSHDNSVLATSLDDGGDQFKKSTSEVSGNGAVSIQQSKPTILMRATEVPDSQEISISQLLPTSSPSVIHVPEDTQVVEETKGVKRRSTVDLPLDSSTTNTSTSSNAKESGSLSSRNVSPAIGSLASYVPLQEYGQKLKRAKLDITNSKATITKCDQVERVLEKEIAVGHKLDQQIAVMEVELAKKRKQSDAIKQKVDKYRESNNSLRKQAEMVIRKSTRTYDAMMNIYKEWSKELDDCLKSDSD